MTKEEIAQNEQFLLLSQCLQLYLYSVFHISTQLFIYLYLKVLCYSVNRASAGSRQFDARLLAVDFAISEFNIESIGIHHHL